MNGVHLRSQPMSLAWCPSDATLIAVLLKPGTVALWNTTSNEAEIVPGLKSDSLTCIQWNHSSSNGVPVLACGHLDGSVWLYNTQTKAVTKLPGVQRTQLASVNHITWDPLSNQYILVTYTNGYMTLLDLSGTLITDFSKSSLDIEMSVFLLNRPGTFVTIGGKAPTLTLWNVSTTTSVEVINIPDKTCGVQGIVATAVPHKFVLALKDGSACVFDLQSRLCEFVTTPAHSETIFDVAFKPSNPDVLATVSYDGSVKVWDIVNMKCTMTLTGQPGVIFSVCWFPGGNSENRLLTTNSEGQIYVWDTQQGTVLARLQHHSGACYRVRFQKDGPLIASVGADGLVVLFSIDGSIVKKYTVKGGVYGCDWSPFRTSFLAVASHDGIVRIFDTSSSSLQPQRELEGHKARVFSVAWNPVDPDLLVSGSDDKTVRAWNVAKHEFLPLKDQMVLEGHSNNVRGLVWCSEIPYMVLSGSWDGSIKIWDTRIKKCVHTVRGP